MELKPLGKDELYIFKLKEELINSLELLYFDAETSEEVKLEDSVNKQPVIAPTLSSPIHKDTDYYKSDLHKFNLKRSLAGLQPLTEEQFEDLLESQSIESISGSESETEDEDEAEDEKDDPNKVKLQALISKLSMESNNEENQKSISYLNTKSAYLLFKSKYLSSDKAFGIYKSLFTENELLKDPLGGLKKLQKLRTGKSALFMIGGGHFAGAIISHSPKDIRGNAPNAKISKEEQAVNIIVSKTFHRYTTRRKQGGSQSASDNAKGKANSAGSSIRRYNEQALIKEVRELLHEWKSYLNECSSIYVRANGASNRKILIGYEGSVLKNEDTRIKSFPFTTQRATTSELKRAWVELSYLKPVDLPKVNEKVKRKQESEGLSTNNKNKELSKSPEPASPTEVHSAELVTLLKKQKAPKLISYIKQHNISVNEFRLVPESKYINYPTLLQFSSANGLNHMVQVLIVNLKADPTIKNQFGKTAADISGESSTRNIFQICRHKLGEDYCNWTLAKVGPAKSKEEFEQEEKQEAEQIKAEKQKRIQEELAKKTEMELKKPAFSSHSTLGGSSNLVNDMNSLSEDQKLRLMREQRARAAEARFKRVAN
ncbi:uncharacterized protein RJT21DRAFT_90166 [Scheffersomyces amazonensis]|uniref:uncharacterized protein n=1 Tax=Scheffersomyces amazonensis TaxID=1078765 RepID=UPI00315D7D60